MFVVMKKVCRVGGCDWDLVVRKKVFGRYRESKESSCLCSGKENFGLDVGGLSKVSGDWRNMDVMWCIAGIKNWIGDDDFGEDIDKRKSIQSLMQSL